MSGPAAKWALKLKDDPKRLAGMSSEAKWFLAYLAFEADADEHILFARVAQEDEERRRDLARLASEAAISLRSARRYVKMFVAEGILEEVGRTGYHNLIAIYRFTMQRGCIAAKAPSNSASGSTIQDRSNCANGSTIQPESDSEFPARIVPMEAANSAVSMQRIVPMETPNVAIESTIQPPSIYGLQELPITPQEKHKASEDRSERGSRSLTASTSQPTRELPTRASDAHAQQQRVLQRAEKGGNGAVNGSDAAPQESSPEFPHNANRRRQIRAVPAFGELDEVQRVRVADLLDVLAAACELPANGNAQRRMAFGIARLVGLGCTYATLRGEIDRLREARVKVTWTKVLAGVRAQSGYATGSSELSVEDLSDDEIRECGYAFIDAMKAQSIVCEPQWRINERCRDLIARGATLDMLPEAIRRARAKAQARKVPTEARALSVCEALADMLGVRTNQPTGTGDPACVDGLEAAFRKLCDEGLCSWPTYAGEQASMREAFGRLMRERGATADMVRLAYHAARGSIAKGKLPGARAILRAMDRITRGKFAGKPPVEDRDFFHRPALEAGEPEARRVTRELFARLMKAPTDGANN